MTAPELLGLTAAALFVLAVLAAGIADAVNAFRTGHSSGACVPVHDRAPVAGGTAVPSPAGFVGGPAVRAGTRTRK